MLHSTITVHSNLNSVHKLRTSHNGVTADHQTPVNNKSSDIRHTKMAQVTSYSENTKQDGTNHQVTIRGCRSHFFWLPTPLPFQSFEIRIWFRKRFNLGYPTHFQTSATIDPIEIYLCFYIRNGHADSCYQSWTKIGVAKSP